MAAGEPRLLGDALGLDLVVEEREAPVGPFSLDLLAREGTVRVGAPNRPDLYPRPSRRLPSRIVQDLLGEVRGER